MLLGLLALKVCTGIGFQTLHFEQKHHHTVVITLNSTIISLLINRIKIYASVIRHLMNLAESWKHARKPVMGMKTWPVAVMNQYQSL